MGRHTVKFRCHSCGHCCTDVICLPSPWDVIRMVRELGESPYKFLDFIEPEDIDGVDDDDPTWLTIGDERYMMALKRGKKGCHFLDKKTKFCTIYESRPLLCRLFPFKLEENKKGEFKGFTLHDDVGCPRNRDGVMNTEPLYEIYLEDTKLHEDYDALVEAFNEQDYADKKPEDFIATFITLKKKEKTSK